MLNKYIKLLLISSRNNPFPVTASDAKRIILLLVNIINFSFP